MVYLLNVAYLLLAALAAPWLVWQRWRHGKRREGLWAKFWGDVPTRAGSARCLWLHAVSVGEVNLLQVLLERFEARHPEWDCVISTTTKAGYDLARQKYAPRTVFYCPLDFSWAVRRAIRRIRPDLLVLAELELWPNLVDAARRAQVKVAIVNGRLSERSFRGYKRIGWLARRMLAGIDLIAVQNEEYAERFVALGASAQAVHVTGSVKFDGACLSRDAEPIQRLADLAGIEPDDIVFLAGSTQAPEEGLALAAYERLADEFPRLRLILVPRHPERFGEVAELLGRSRVRWQRRTALSESGVRQHSGGVESLHAAEVDREVVNSDQRVSRSPRVLLVDAVGELRHWWGTAHIAFVGGSLTQRGGQNMIEPAAYGCAVAFGPNTWNFKDVVALLLANDAAHVVADGPALEAFLRRCLEEPDYARALGQRAQALVREQQGAAERTMELLEKL